ncbi:MAG: fatty acid--CoA ligase [Sphingomonadaceae bacterium]
MADTKPLLSFDAFIKHWATEAPNRPALREGDRLLTFGGLEAMTAKIVGALLAAGLNKGDRIAWLGKNSDLYFSLFYGAARLGVVMVPVGWRLSSAEIAYIVSDTEARLLFTGSGFDEAARAMSADLPHVERIFSEGEARAWIDDATPTPFTAAADEDAALQLYTSGTTGKPKGAVLSNINLFGLRLPTQDAGLPWSQWDDDEVVMVAMPCAHIGGTGLGVMALAAGVVGYILPEFSGEAVLDAVEHGGVTRFFMVPAALQMVINHPRAATTDFTRLKYIFYGAAPIPLELLRECIKVFGAQFIQAYGMTETTGTIVSLWPEDHDPNGNQRMRGQGRALPGVELKIVDDDGNALPPHQVGELMTRSSNNMMTYWKLPEATASTVSADGWLKTGDAAYMDEDGYLYIHDRMKDMIISGGENIYPAEVESAIYGHPAVAEVAVIGIPDAKWGETVKAICVAKPGMTIDEADVIAWTRAKIAAFKVPKSIDVIDALPRNASGKILRKDLRAPYWVGYTRMVN